MVAWNTKNINFDEKIADIYKVLVAGEHLYKAMKLGIPEQITIGMIETLVKRLENLKKSVEESSGGSDEMGLKMYQILSIATKKYEELNVKDFIDGKEKEV